MTESRMEVMRRPLIVLGAGVVLFLVLTALKAIYNEYVFNWKGEEEVICRSAEQAEAQGVLVCRLRSRDTNRLPVVDNRDLVINAWVEERHQDSHCLNWLTSVSRLCGYNVCISTRIDQDVRIECPSLPTMIGASSVEGQTLYYFRSAKWDNHPLVVRIGNSATPRGDLVELSLVPSG